MASACSSSVSMQKSGTSNSTRRKSCDTVCSSNSSCFLKKKKPSNPLAASVRTVASRTDHSNIVRQRVLSAKLIKLRNLQSQLNDANYHLMELAKENRALKTLQKRQDKALNNYEGVNADLPRLIKSHEEENRTLSEKNRGLRKTVKDLNEQLKMKDDELMTVKDQLRHLTNLTKDRHLGEREKLKELLEESKSRIKKYETEIGLLNRKLLLEEKNSKQRLNNEITKHKRCQRELAHAFSEIDKLSEIKEKSLPKRRFDSSPRQRQSMSMVCLTNQETSYTTASFDIKDHCSDSSSDLKLEPIHKRSDSSDSKSQETVMQSPADKIKARLSASTDKPVSVNELTDMMEKLSSEEQSIKKAFYNNRNVKIHSAKLETLPIKPKEPELNDYMDDLSDDGSSSTDETPAVLNSFNEPLDAKQKDELPDIVTEFPSQDVNNVKNNSEDIILAEDDMELVNQIWSEEYSFRKSRKDTNGNVTKKNPAVALEDKRKLLATLRDIDNGKSIDGVLDGKKDMKKSQLLKELFG